MLREKDIELIKDNIDLIDDYGLDEFFNNIVNSHSWDIHTTYNVIKFLEEDAKIDVIHLISKMPFGAYTDSKDIGNLLIPGNIEEIDSYCSALSSITHIEIENPECVLHSSAFERSEHLESVSLPRNLEEIPISCFEYSGIRDISLPITVKKIHEGAFRNCSNIEEIHIPQYCKSIGINAFRHCANLNLVTLPEDCIVADENCENYKHITFKRYSPGMNENFAKIELRKEHYDKHVLGLPDSKGEIDKHPFKESNFPNELFYEAIANIIANASVDNTEIFGFCTFGNGGFTYYKYDTKAHAIVIYYYDESKNKKEPIIRTLYNALPNKIKNLRNSYIKNKDYIVFDIKGVSDLVDLADSLNAKDATKAKIEEPKEVKVESVASRKLSKKKIKDNIYF